jgi:lysophospholipase L1-like esterase
MLTRFRVGALLVVTLFVGSAKPFPASAAVTKRTLRWVAMGDSYSAGVGVGPVGLGCDKDGLAYAPRAAQDILAGTFSFPGGIKHVACSGATMKKLDPNKANQFAAVVASTDVVTITIGGNDIGFAPKILGCVFGPCGPDLLEASPSGGDGGDPDIVSWEDLFGRLRDTYLRIRKQMNPNGHLYVLSYPIPFSLRDEFSQCSGFSPMERRAANALVNRIGDTIYKAVEAANSGMPGEPTPDLGHVHFVDWRSGDRIPGGYTTPSGVEIDTYSNPAGLCDPSTKNPEINGKVGALHASINPLSALGNSFHPKSNGYWTAAERLATQIKRNFSSIPATQAGSGGDTLVSKVVKGVLGIEVTGVESNPGRRYSVFADCGGQRTSALLLPGERKEFDVPVGANCFGGSEIAVPDAATSGQTGLRAVLDGYSLILTYVYQTSTLVFLVVTVGLPPKIPSQFTFTVKGCGIGGGTATLKVTSGVSNPSAVIPGKTCEVSLDVKGGVVFLMPGSIFQAPGANQSLTVTATVTFKQP